MLFCEEVRDSMSRAVPLCANCESPHRYVTFRINGGRMGWFCSDVCANTPRRAIQLTLPLGIKDINSGLMGGRLQ